MKSQMSDDNTLLRDTLASVFKEDLIQSDQFRKDMWSALANVQWFQDSNPSIHYLESFRSAGGFIAKCSGVGDYLTYYMCGPDDHVSDYIAKKMKAIGWSYK